MAKQGKKSIVELAQEVEAQAKKRLDLVTDTRALKMDIPGHTNVPALFIENEEVEVEVITPYAHGQIAARLDIPKKYYDRCLQEEPDILMANVNGWFEAKPERRMLRIYQDNANTLRAFLSDRYRRIDNYELLMHSILPTLMETPELKDDLQIVSCEVTNLKLYIKCISQSITAHLGIADVNDQVNAGFVITNSEVGMGAVHISQYIYRRVCRNGMIGESLFRKYHVGRNVDDSFDQYMQNDTLQADDKAIMLKARDMIRAAINKDAFKDAVDSMRRTHSIKVVNPQKAVEVLSNQLLLGMDAQQGIMARFFKNEDRDGRTMFNMVNAVTQYAEDVDDYDAATEMEHAGYKIMNLPTRALSEIAMAR